MRALLAGLIGIAVTLPAQSEPKTPTTNSSHMVGTYGCVIQHSVGIQSEKSGKVFSGKIEPTVRHFLLTIKPTAKEWSAPPTLSSCWAAQFKFTAEMRPAPFRLRGMFNTKGANIFLDRTCTSTFIVWGDGNFTLFQSDFRNSYTATGLCKKIK